jgi:hypothetical protein
MGEVATSQPLIADADVKQWAEFNATRLRPVRIEPDAGAVRNCVSRLVPDPSDLEIFETLSPDLVTVRNFVLERATALEAYHFAMHRDAMRAENVDQIVILNSQMRWERNPEEENEDEGSSIHSDGESHIYLFLTIPDGKDDGRCNPVSTCYPSLPALAAAKTFWELLNSRDNEGLTVQSFENEIYPGNVRDVLVCPRWDMNGWHLQLHDHLVGAHDINGGDTGTVVRLRLRANAGSIEECGKNLWKTSAFDRRAVSMAAMATWSLATSNELMHNMENYYGRFGKECVEAISKNGFLSKQKKRGGCAVMDVAC